MTLSLISTSYKFDKLVTDRAKSHTKITPVKIMLWHVLLGVSTREYKSSKSVGPLTVRLVCQKSLKLISIKTAY